MKQRMIAFFSAFLIFFLTFNLPVYAVGNSWSDSAKLSYFNQNFGKINSELNGVYFKIDNLKQDLDDYFEDNKSSYGNYNSIDDLFVDDVDIYYQEGSSGNSNVSFGQTFRQAMRDWCNAYIDANSEYFYGYSFNSGLFSNSFDSTDKLNKFLAFIETYEDDYYVMFNFSSFVTYPQSFVLMPKDYIDSYLFSAYESQFTTYLCHAYKNGSPVPNISLNVFRYDDTAQNWVESTFKYNYTYTQNRLLKYEGVSNLSNSMADYNYITLNSETLKIYKNLSSLQLGNQANPEYYVSGSYNTTISGSYNTTTENIDNSITYNIINDYANDYYDDNNRYPDPQQIIIYINNYIPDPDPNPTPTPDPNPTPTPDPNPGGGGDDDDEDEESGFWELIKKVLDFVSKLFDTIAGFLADLVDSLGDIVTAVIDNIFDIITSLKDGIPNIIGSLLQYFMPFLPEEVITVITFSIALTVIVGIIKLLRG